MKSPLPKVLHPLAGRTLIDHAIDVAEGLGCERIVVVLGTGAPTVRAHVAARLGEGAIAVQDPPLGTGHAVLAASQALAGFDGDVVVTYADSALLTPEAIEPLFALRAAGADVAVLGFRAADPAPYGRLILGDGDRVLRIVETREAGPDELKVDACNSGVVAASAPLLFELLGKVGCANAKGEYYLTDVVGLAEAAGKTARAAFAAEEMFLGVNSQAELAVAEGAFQRRRRAELMDAGVTLIAPETVQLAWDTRLAPAWWWSPMWSSVRASWWRPAR